MKLLQQIGIFGALLAALVGVSSCSAVWTKHYAVKNKPLYSYLESSTNKSVVYWNCVWRLDQKEPTKRESMIRRALGRFFLTNERFGAVELVESLPVLSTEATVLADAKARGAGIAYVFRFEELTPNINIFLSPILWETHNEILVRIKVFDAKQGSIGEDMTIHWFRGGAFTANGADMLDGDLYDALGSVFF